MSMMHCFKPHLCLNRKATFGENKSDIILHYFVLFILYAVMAKNKNIQPNCALTAEMIGTCRKSPVRQKS